MNPIDFKPRSPEQFIGPARELARVFDRILRRSSRKGTPIRIFNQGEPGIGKSALVDYLLQQLSVSPFNLIKRSGAALSMDHVEDFARSLQLTDLFGGYRVLHIEEVERVHHLVQARLLTLLDDLPPYSAILCTSNKNVKDLDERFQTRFQVFTLKSPTPDDIKGLLARFRLNKAEINRIATLCCGNVRLALLDAQSALDQIAI
jgi:replication-associated recombination protein RarA